MSKIDYGGSCTRDVIDDAMIRASGKKSNYDQLFGTPEKVANFAIKKCRWDCFVCPFDGNLCDKDRTASTDTKDALLEWFRGDA